MTKYIFLDFDGVLHAYGRPKFELVPKFQDVVENYDVRIVFSTSWREYQSLSQLQSHFHPKITHKLVGLTPILANNHESAPHLRHREILLYLKQNNIESEWRALDDMDCLFPPSCPNLILCNGGVGFSNREKYILKTWLKA